MSRNRRVLLALSLAFVAVGMVTPSAQASDEFHCGVAGICRLRTGTDGTGATAHHVFVVENEAKTESVSFTCESFRADAQFSEAAATEISTTFVNEREAYANCKVNGSPGVVVHMNSCSFKLTGGAGGTSTSAEVHLLCSAPGNAIQITIAEGSCTFEIGPQTHSGLGYHNIGTFSSEREVTVTANVSNIVVTATAGCSSLIKTNQTLRGTYTTGNTLITAETTVTESMSEFRFE